MVDLEGFSIGSLDIGDLAIKVRYRRRGYGEACFRVARPRQQRLSSPQQQRRQHRKATEHFSCSTKRPPSLRNQDTPETCQGSQLRGGQKRSPTLPTVFGSTPSENEWPTGGREARKNDDDDDDEKYFDGTGLLVWPGSRLLASFLVDQLGARRLFPPANGSLPGCWCERCSTTCGEMPLIPVVGGQKVSTIITTTTTPEHCERRDELTTTSMFNDGNSTCGNVECGGEKLLPATGEIESAATEIRHTKHPATGTVNGGGCRAETRTKATHPAAQNCGSGIVTLERTVRRPASRAVLELGAGTGICGMAASLALDCSVIMTDRRDDVLDNLRENVRLNGLSQKAQVVRLAWGGASTETRELPSEIRKQSPFEVRSSGCRAAGLSKGLETLWVMAVGHATQCA